MLESCEEADKIYDFMKQNQVEELPCESGFNDEYIVCDVCGRVVRSVADSAFWKRPYLQTSGGEIYCEKCVELDDMLEELNHTFDKCDTVFSEQDYLDKGFTNYVQTKYNVEFCEETKISYEELMDEVAEFENAIFLLISASPFEVETKLMVR
jgi:hypothetical protein